MQEPVRIYNEYGEYDRDAEYTTIRKLLKTKDEKDVAARLVKIALMDDLTERQAEMVQLYYIEQHTMRAIAARLGVNISTVSRTLQSGRTKLKRALCYHGQPLITYDAQR